jgi:hypothetical protein
VAYYEVYARWKCSEIRKARTRFIKVISDFDALKRIKVEKANNITKST